MSKPFNAVHPQRGAPFRIEDYPEDVQALIRSKLKPVEEIVEGLPKSFRFFTSFALGQTRGILRAMSMRDDWEDVLFLNALLVEPYAILRHPGFRLCSGYFSPVDRLLAGKMGKTVAHIPKQFCQFEEVLLSEGYIDAYFHTVAPPDEDGYVNLGPSVDVVVETLKDCAAKGKRIIFEINSHVPWVAGSQEHNGNRIHLSVADAVYELHERLPQLPPIQPTDQDRAIADHVLPFIQDGDTVQLGIGGVPNYIAAQIKDELKGLKIHSEMLIDAMVDLVDAGAVDSTGKEYMDGLIVGTFAAGTDKLYDWLDRNSDVVLLPVREVNDVRSISKNPRMKSINSTLLVDFHGQAASDAVGYRQITGIGGQLEFVTGSQLSEGGRSVLCLKSTSEVNGKLRSNIVPSLPRGTPVSVPRQLVDVVVTEHGAAELRYLDGVERTRALIAIADPRFREELIEQAKRLGLWDHAPGFGRFAQRALFNNLGWVRRLKGKLDASTEGKASVLLDEVKRIVKTPDLPRKAVEFYRQNRA